MEIIKENSKIVDVIIPVYQPDDDCKELLRRLKQQTYKVRNILLMHTEDGVDMTPVKSLYSNVTEYKVKKENFDHGRTRAEGMQLSDADVVVFMTQDAIPADRQLIEKLLDALVIRQTAAAYARQLPKSGCSAVERYTRAFNYPAKGCVKSLEDLETMGIKTYFCSNVCAAYNRKCYEEIGGFPKKAIFNEDMIFAARAVQKGYQIVYAADAEVFHSHNYTRCLQFKRNFDMAVSQRQHPELFSGITSETEGIRMVKQAALHFLKKKRPGSVCALVLDSAAKYMGYRLGMQYRKLPKWLILRCSLNRGYWR